MALRPRLGGKFQCPVVGSLNYFIQIYIYIYIFTRGDFFVKIIAWILDHGADIHKLLKVGLVGLCYQAQQQSILP